MRREKNTRSFFGKVRQEERRRYGAGKVTVVRGEAAEITLEGL